MSDVTVELHEAEIAGVLRDPGFGATILDGVRGTLVPTARSLAPVRRSGPSRGGAASITATLVGEAEGFTVRVSWDAVHAYMRFQDLGTRYVTARHFLERAARMYSTT